MLQSAVVNIIIMFKILDKRNLKDLNRFGPMSYFLTHDDTRT